MGYFVHASSCIDDGCEIGDETRIWHFSHIMRGCKIGKHCNIGQNVVVSPNVVLGDGVKIQNNVSVYTGVVCEDGVFLGPSCVFTNVMNPRAFIERKNEFRNTLIKEGASIGANATIVCGHTIGRYALIGAGAVVTHDVPDYALVYGNPARIHGYVCQCGEQISFVNGRAACSACGKRYLMEKDHPRLEEMGDSRKGKDRTMRRCTRCIMDDLSDPFIYFDENGYCNYCNTAVQQIGSVYFPNAEGRKKLTALIDEVKAFGIDQKYDCIMGIYGGLDSSYLAYLGFQWGLKVLAVHIDDGYDTEISKLNIEKLIAATGFDYEVIKPDPAQYNDLTLAYMKAGVPNIAAPQDNILFAFLYKKMQEHNIKYFLSGGNFALECILQKGNTHTPFDMDHLMDIHNKFGREPVDKLEFLSTKQRCENNSLLGLKSLCPLDYIDYNRDQAFQELKDFCGFEYYGRKHLENILTAFAQLYWFPKKFGVDKRTSHLSSMIVSGQMTREEALKQLSEPLYQKDQMDAYIAIIKQNMKISDEEFEKIMSAPAHRHEDYKVEKYITDADEICANFDYQFLNQFKKIFIYGAGEWGIYVYKEYFCEHADSFDGFVVSDGHKKFSETNGYPVYELSELELSDDTGLIIAVKESQKIKEILDQKGFSHYMLLSK